MKYLVSLMLLMLSFAAAADAYPPLMNSDLPVVRIQSVNGVTTIRFPDFANANDFESYTCEVKMDGWVFDMPAEKVTVDGDYVYYQCQSQGYLNPGQAYDVWFVFEDWIYRERWYSPSYTLHYREE